MRFEEAYDVWTGKRLSQEKAARILGVCSVHSTAIVGVITDTSGGKVSKGQPTQFGR